MEVAHTAQNWRKADRLSGSRGSFSFSNQRNRNGVFGGVFLGGGISVTFPGISSETRKKNRGGMGWPHGTCSKDQLN
jgi:hypothetical protein